jgi:hypothetical protein
MTAGPFFPLDELAEAGSLPFGELLDEVLGHIWVGGPSYDASTDEGVVEVLVDQAVEVPVPGVPALALALGDQPGGVNAELRVRFEPSVSFTAELPLTLRVDGSVLRPLKPGTKDPDPDRKTLDITLGSVRVGYGLDGGFLLDIPKGLTLPRCMIGTTGVILSATNVRWLTPASTNLPPSAPSGFIGLHFDGASIEVVDLPVDPGKISMSDVYLGTGGFSGTVAWTDPSLSWDGAEFQGVATGGLFGFEGALTKVELGFKQSALTACDIQADLYVPYLEKRVGLDLALDGRGGVSAAAGLPTSKPAETAVTAGTGGALLHVDLEVLQLDLDEIRFAAGGGRDPSVALTGRVKLDIAAINSPTFAFKRLSIDTAGNVAIDGGWLDVTQAKAADVHGFQLEVSRIGFGAEADGRVWFGLNGGLRLAQGLPMGASVEGLKVSWDPNATDVAGTVGVSLEGVGLDVEVPNTFRFKGSVALFHDEAFGDGFTGHVSLQLIPLKLTIDAQLMIGRTADGVEYVFFYLAIDLPTGIPLFSTGAAIYGFAGLVAVNLRPDRHGDEGWWHGWHQRPPKGVLEPRRKWRVERGAFAIGLGTTIGTAPDDGFAFSTKVLLIVSLPGPVIFLQGKGSFVTQRADSQAPDSTGQFESLVVLDVPAKLFSANLAAAYEKKNLLTIAGEADAAFSWARVPPPDVWHLYVGEKEPPEKRVHGRLIDLLNIDSYFQLRGTGIALGGRIAFDGDWHFGPVHAWAHAHLSTDASLSWKPPQFEGSLSIHGDAGLEAFGAKVLIVLDGSVLARGPTPWYLAIHLHLELVIDLWFFKWSFEIDVPLEWGDKDLPLPEPVRPVIASIGAQHPKVAEDVAVLDGATIAPDARPVVVFERPVLDRGMVGTPNSAALSPDTVGPRSFSYRLGHVVLASGAGPARKLIGAAGVLDVVGGAVRLPAALQLPDVAGTTLELLPGPTRLPVTGRTTTGVTVTGTPPEGEHPYRLRTAPVHATVQVTAVAQKPLGIADLTLDADPGLPGGAFAGGTCLLGGATWTVLASAGRTVTIAAPAAAPGIGNAELTGPPPPEVGGAWLPVEDRTDGAQPGPTTKLMLWARTPFAWFRNSERETYDGFDAHNPDYACGPEPVEEPICLAFDDIPLGALTGTFHTDIVPGVATGQVQVLPSNADPADHRLEIGVTPTLHSSFGTIELHFGPPVDWVRVRCSTREGGAVTALRDGATVAAAFVPKQAAAVDLAGDIDAVRVEGTEVTVEQLCFKPGWTCVPFEAASFPQGSTEEQSYAGLKVYSCAPMHVTADELWVDPVDVILPGGGINPKPIAAHVALISVRLPQPVTRLRFRVTQDCQVWVGGGGVEILKTAATAGQTVAAGALHGVIEQFAISSQSRVGMTGPCFDAGPFGWQRWEQWSWRKSMQVATEALTREDPVLAPGQYTLSLLCGVQITGRSPATEWEDQRDATFTVGVPPGLTTPTGNVDQDRRYPTGGALADLTPYVDTTVPVAGERPAYRAYDVGVAFNEPYVSRMFLTAQAGLSVAVVDPNGTDRRAGAPNLWGRGPELKIGEQETEFIKTLHGDGTQLCAPVDMTKLVHDEGLSAGAGELLAPSAQHMAELRATGHARTAYRFSFTTSRFADFRHQLAHFDGRARRHQADGTGQVDPSTLGARLDTAQTALATAIADFDARKAAATTGTPTAAQLDAYPVALCAVRAARAALATARSGGFGELWDRCFANPPPALLPEGVELTHIVAAGGASDALLLESAEPIRWERTVLLDLASASVTPLRLHTLPSDAGAPDIGAFRWDGVDATTDVELRTHLGALGPRVDGAWTLRLAVPEARRVRMHVTVGEGGAAMLTPSGTGTGAAATSGPTGSGAPVVLEVAGASLSAVSLAGTHVMVLAVEVERPFEPLPAAGPLRLSRGVLPPAGGPPTHSIDVTAYADSALDGYRITWFDALQPSVGGAYHSFAPGTAIVDGRTARVYGGVTTTPPERGVDLYAGGTVGVLPKTGVVFRLIAPDGAVAHELCRLPDTVFTPITGVRVFADGDQTRTLLLAPGPLTAGFGRLRLRFNRDAAGELPRLSVGGDTGPEDAALSFVLR